MINEWKERKEGMKTQKQRIKGIRKREKQENKRIEKRRKTG